MKQKSVLVIILSSIVISVVILFTIFGLSLYLGWREGESAKLHKDEIALLNAKLYSQFINIHDLRAQYEKNVQTLQNNWKKAISDHGKFGDRLKGFSCSKTSTMVGGSSLRAF